MKVSYMLLNRSELGNGVPSGMAWQWIHCIEDEKQLVSILNKVKKIITILGARPQFIKAAAVSSVFGKHVHEILVHTVI